MKEEGRIEIPLSPKSFSQVEHFEVVGVSELKPSFQLCLYCFTGRQDGHRDKVVVRNYCKATEGRKSQCWRYQVVTQLVAVSVSATITVRIFIIFAKISKTSHFSSRIGVSKCRCGVFKKFVICL